MTDAREPLLERECRVFTRYLLGADPPPYVVEKYAAAHEPGFHGPAAGGRGRDEALLALARRGVFFTRLADAYAVVFSRGGVLRRKLILLLAILESYGPTSRRVDSPSAGSPSSLFVGIAVRALVFAAMLLVSPLIVLPLGWIRGSSKEASGPENAP